MDYQGRFVAPGEVFLVTPLEASILTRRMKARLAPKDAPALFVPEVTPSWYRRRDMRADG
jgi:hypothetical protein